MRIEDVMETLQRALDNGAINLELTATYTDLKGGNKVEYVVTGTVLSQNGEAELLLSTPAEIAQIEAIAEQESARRACRCFDTWLCPNHN